MARKSQTTKRRLGRGLGSLISNPVRVDVPGEKSRSRSRDNDNDNEHGAPADRASSAPEASASGASTATATLAAPARPATHASDTMREHTADDPTAASTREDAQNPAKTWGFSSSDQADTNLPDDVQSDDATNDAASSDSVTATMLPIERVQPNPDQPRKNFDESTLNALAESIRTAGMMQPIVVRPLGEAFQIIAGERRWRAAQIVKLTHIPAVIREIDDRQVAEWSLIENLQRDDLNPIEKATAFQRLLDEFGLTHQQIADSLGVNRVTVSNHLRLLELDSSCTELVRSGLLDLGHARALLGLRNVAKRQGLAAKAIRESWSVRAIEQEVRRLEQSSGGAGGDSAADQNGDAANNDGQASMLTGRAAHLRDLERQLSEYLGTRVSIKVGRRNGSGKLIVDFYNNKQFEGVLERMKFSPK